VGNLTPGTPKEVHVGDKGRRISYIFKDATGLAARVLTGYAAWISFWVKESATPHVVRAATVDGANGKPVYKTLGDEFAAEGEVLAQFTVMDPTTGLRTSSEILRYIVMRKPT